MMRGELSFTIAALLMFALVAAMSIGSMPPGTHGPYTPTGFLFFSSYPEFMDYIGSTPSPDQNPSCDTNPELEECQYVQYDIQPLPPYYSIPISTSAFPQGYQDVIEIQLTNPNPYELQVIPETDQFATPDMVAAGISLSTDPMLQMVPPGAAIPIIVHITAGGAGFSCASIDEYAKLHLAVSSPGLEWPALVEVPICPNVMGAGFEVVALNIIMSPAVANPDGFYLPGTTAPTPIATVLPAELGEGITPNYDYTITVTCPDCGAAPFLALFNPLLDTLPGIPVELEGEINIPPTASTGSYLHTITFTPLATDQAIQTIAFSIPVYYAPGGEDGQGTNVAETSISPAVFRLLPGETDTGTFSIYAVTALQSYFVQITGDTPGAEFPDSDFGARGFDFEDWEGDGDIDAIAISYGAGEYSLILFEKRDGVLRGPVDVINQYDGEPITFPAPEDPRGIEAVDWEGDGDMDLLISGLDYVRLIPNQQVEQSLDTPYFSFASDPVPLEDTDGNPIAISHTMHIQALDWEGDGDLDLMVAAGSTSAPKLYLRDETGFTLQSIPSLPGAARAWALDWDGDGDMDLVTRYWDNDIFFYLSLQNNDGTFAAKTALQYVTEGDPYNFQDVISDGLLFAGADFADLDGNGAQDLIIREKTQIGGTDLSFNVYSNNPAGQVSKLFMDTSYTENKKMLLSFSPSSQVPSLDPLYLPAGSLLQETVYVNVPGYILPGKYSYSIGGDNAYVFVLDGGEIMEFDPHYISTAFESGDSREIGLGTAIPGGETPATVQFSITGDPELTVTLEDPAGFGPATSGSYSAPLDRSLLVAVSAPGAQIGNYEAVITFTPDGYLPQEVVIFVEVGSTETALMVSPTALSKTLYPGTSYTKYFHISNVGSIPAQFSLSATGAIAQFVSNPIVQDISLDPGATYSYKLKLTLPTGATAGTYSGALSITHPQDSPFTSPPPVPLLLTAHEAEAGETFSIYEALEGGSKFLFGGLLPDVTYTGTDSIKYCDDFSDSPISYSTAKRGILGVDRRYLLPIMGPETSGCIIRDLKDGTQYGFGVSTGYRESLASSFRYHGPDECEVETYHKLKKLEWMPIPIEHNIESAAEEERKYLTLAWLPPVSNPSRKGLEEYGLYRSKDGGAYSRLSYDTEYGSEAAIPATALSFTDEQVETGHTYCYRILPWADGLFVYKGSSLGADWLNDPLLSNEACEVSKNELNPPEIAINYPLDGQEYTMTGDLETDVDVRFQDDSNLTLIKVYYNGVELEAIPVEALGYDLQKQYDIEDYHPPHTPPASSALGENTLTFYAEDLSKNTAEASVTLQYAPLVVTSPAPGVPQDSSTLTLTFEPQQALTSLQVQCGEKVSAEIFSILTAQYTEQIYDCLRLGDNTILVTMKSGEQSGVRSYPVYYVPFSITDLGGMVVAQGQAVAISGQMNMGNPEFLTLQPREIKAFRDDIFLGSGTADPDTGEFTIQFDAAGGAGGNLRPRLNTIDVVIDSGTGASAKRSTTIDFDYMPFTADIPADCAGVISGTVQDLTYINALEIYCKRADGGYIKDSLIYPTKETGEYARKMLTRLGFCNQGGDNMNTIRVVALDEDGAEIGSIEGTCTR